MTKRYMHSTPADRVERPPRSRRPLWIRAMLVCGLATPLGVGMALAATIDPPVREMTAHSKAALRTAELADRSGDIVLSLGLSDAAEVEVANLVPMAAAAPLPKGNLATSPSGNAVNPALLLFVAGLSGLGFLARDRKRKAPSLSWESAPKP